MPGKGQPGKPVALLSASELRAKLERARAASSKVNQMLIDAGRGYERPSDMRGKTDALSRLWEQTTDRESELRFEQQRRREYHGGDGPIKRKSNPAKRRKPVARKSTPAQRAARAEFARIMKAGGFGAKKRRAPPKRRRNPIVAAPVKIRRTSSVGSLAGRRAARRAAPRRMTNPRAPARYSEHNVKPARYSVYAARGGVRGKLIASFTSKADATQYAQAWATLHRCPAGIVGSR